MSIANDQSGTFNNGNASSGSITWGGTPAAGSVAFAEITHTANPGAYTPPSGWLQIGATISSIGASVCYSSLWWTANAGTSGSGTWSWANSVQTTGAAESFTGLFSPTVDQNNSNTGAGTAASTGSITTTGSAEIVCAAYGVGSAMIGTPGWSGSGFTDASVSNGITSIGCDLQFKFGTGTLSDAVTISLTGNWTGIIGSVKGSLTAPATPPVPPKQPQIITPQWDEVRLPQQLIRNVQPPPIPPFKPFVNNWLAAAISAWTPPDPPPQLNPRNAATVALTVTRPPPVKFDAARAVLASWQPADPVVVPQTRNVAPQAFAGGQQPPRFTTAKITGAVLPWTPPDPQPPQGVRDAGVLLVVAGNQPLVGRAAQVIETILITWTPPDPQPPRDPKNVATLTLAIGQQPPPYSIVVPTDLRMAWEPPDPQPQRKYPLQTVSVDVPPTQHFAEMMLLAVAAWTPPDPMPVQGVRDAGVLIGVAGQAPPPYSAVVMYGVVRSWEPGPPAPPRLSPTLAPIGLVYGQPPPPTSTVNFDVAVLSWTPPDPPPQRAVPIRLQSADLPPRVSAVNLASEVRSWTPPDPPPQRLPTLTLVIGQAPPPASGVNAAAIVQAWQPAWVAPSQLPSGHPTASIQPLPVNADVVNLTFTDSRIIPLFFEVDPMTGEMQSFSAFQRDDKLLVLTANTNGSILGDLYEFIVTDSVGVLQLKVTSSDHITITFTGSGYQPAIVQVDLTGLLNSLPAVLDAGPTQYYWYFRRTNPGRRDTLAAGVLPLSASPPSAT